MKKILSMILSLVLLLGCAAAAGEETAAKVELGTIDINGAFTLQCGVPEGYQASPILVTKDALIAALTNEDPQKPMMTLSVSYDETYGNVERLNDLDADALALLEETFYIVDPTVEITYGETGLGTTLLIARQSVETPHYLDFLSIYKGYFIEFVLTPSEGDEDRELTEDEMKIAVDFLTDLDFIEADEAAVLARKAANTDTFTAEIFSYDKETSEMLVTLKMPMIIMKESLEGLLEEGAKINLADEVEIESIEKSGNDVILNNEIVLRDEGDGSYHVYYAENDTAYLIAAAENMAYPVSKDAVFEDHIDPETLETLETPTIHTLDEFAEMLATEGVSAVGPGFALDNVTVSIGEDNTIDKIERHYVPWQ